MDLDDDINPFGHLAVDPVMPHLGRLFRVVRTAAYTVPAGLFNAPLTAQVLTRLPSPGNFDELMVENGIPRHLEGLAALAAVRYRAVPWPVRRGDDATVDFYDGNGEPFDVKTPAPGHNIQAAADSVAHELEGGGQTGVNDVYVPRVVMDTTFLSNGEHAALWGYLAPYVNERRLIEVCLPYTLPRLAGGTWHWLP